MADDLCGFVQIPGAGVLPQPGPKMHDLVIAGLRQRINVWKFQHELLEIGDDGADLSLL